MSSLSLLATLIGDVTRADDATLLDQDLLREAVQAPLTLDDFFELLAACKDRYLWSNDYGFIRAYDRESQDYCPITAALEGHGNQTAHWEGLAQQHGLGFADACEIVAAADEGLDHDPALRARLLRVVGLEEEGV